MYSSYKVGKGIASWENGSVQHISFVVTEDCNLRCKYCYITHKSANKRMNLEVAKKFIDILFSDNIRRSDCVILEFIGGEPLIEIEIIDKITDYFKLTAYSKKNKWYWNYRISICTNGVNYNHEKIQNYFMKNQNKIAVSITLDGIKKKHDLNRVFPNGDGSYDIIIKNISKWKSQFTPSTKVTVTA